MPVYSQHGKAILQEHLDSGKPLDDIQLNEINLECFFMKGRDMKQLSCRRSILDDASFVQTGLYSPFFEESNLKDSLFQNSVLYDANFNSCILLRSRFSQTTVYGGAFKRSYMQRIMFERSLFRDTLFLNVEAGKSTVTGSVFMYCDFLFDDSGGISGFQGSEFTGSIFINCTFSGYALTAIEMQNCTFIRCAFALLDWEDIKTDNVQFCLCSGIPGWKGIPEPEPEYLDNDVEAARFLAEVRGEI